jgi:3-deoxy-manno-octulosonate cytidylyltransferase (CMP-KDO synthetase)
MLEFSVAIPARFASTRLPGKPLQLIGGKPMICHVAERALAAGAAEVVIATDDERIAEAVKGDAVRVCMTKPEHRTGTDRLSECAQQLNWPDDRIVVNLQGDEPFAPAIGIRQVAELLAGSTSPMATLGVALASHAEFMNPNVVKLVHDGQGRALYFSRAPIPWPRNTPHSLPTEALRHIGIYAYRSGFLQQLSRLPAGQLEVCESLEQLRVLENGFAIAVAPALAEFPPGVDTWEDLAAANAFWLKP